MMKFMNRSTYLRHLMLIFLLSLCAACSKVNNVVSAEEGTFNPVGLSGKPSPQEGQWRYPGVPAPDWPYDTPKPLVSPQAFKTTIQAGEVVVFSGMRGATTIVFSGTKDNPAFLINEGTFTGALTLTGQYGIVIGGNYRGLDGALISLGDYISVREANISDADTTWGAAVYSNGNNFVLMNSVIGPSGNVDLDTEVDHHCWKLEGNYIWSIENRFSSCQGDAIQVGDQNNSPEEIQNVYIVGNHAENNLQTGYWVKNANRVIIAYNTATNHNRGEYSVPASAGGQYSHSDLWIMYNDFSDSIVGIRIASTEGGSGRFFIGNEVNVNTRPSPRNPYDNGWALQSWSSDIVYMYYNKAESAAGARAAIEGCGNDISGFTHNARLSKRNCNLQAVRTRFSRVFGEQAPF